MIDEKKLKEDVKEYYSTLKPQYISKLVEAVVEDIIDIIDEQPKLDVPDTNVGKWTPVTKGLPKESGKYLVTLKGGDVETDSFSKVDNKWVYFNTQIAWFDRPLPEPYKGDE